MNILTVSELTALISGVLEKTFDYLWIEGEVSNLRVPSSGHHYFTLKDKRSQIRSVLFRSQRKRVPFDIETGQNIICLGRLGVYAERGEYQIIIEHIEPAGIGSLHLAYEQRKNKLEKEGLFAVDRKRPIPKYPGKVGIITSPTGAAIRDILNVLGRRNSGVKILLAPVIVQGKGAAEEIAEGIESLNRYGDSDVIIVGRGGGSIEDLWAFNEEVVARAIYSSGIPVISAVGHERDFTIADFVADMRAPTPSAAAEMVAKSTLEISIELDSLKKRITSSIMSHLAKLRVRTDQETRILKDPRKVIRETKMRLDDLICTAEKKVIEKTNLLRAELRGVSGRLNGLSPLAVLARGYSITLVSPGGDVVKDKDMVHIGDRVKVLLHEGYLVCMVEQKG